MAGPVKAKSDTKYYIHSAICIAIMVFGRFIPVSYPFTPEGMMVAAILVGAIYGFINGNVFWPSILALLLIGTSDVTTVGAIFASLMSNGTLMFLTALFLLVGYLNHVGFARALALKIVQSKVTKGRPWVLTAFMLIAAIMPASVMSVTAVFVMSLTLLYAVCDEVGMERTDKWAVLTAIGIACACSFALFLLPIQVVPIALFGQMVAAGYEGVFPVAQFILFTAAVVAASIFGIVLVIKALKPDVSKLYNYAPPEEKIKFTGEQRFAAFLVILLLSWFIVPQFLPAGSAPRVFFAQFGPFAVVISVLMIGAFVQWKGKPRIDMAEATKGLNLWPMIIMVGSVLVISDILNRPELGFVAFVNETLGPIFNVGSPVIFTLIVMLIALVITTFVQGTLVFAIMVPLIIPIALANGFPVIATLAPFMVVANIGIIFPSSHPLGAVMHGHESIGPKPTVKYVAMFMAVSFVAAVIIGIPLGMLLF